MPITWPGASLLTTGAWSIEHSLQRLSKRMQGELGITGPQRLVSRRLLKRERDPGDRQRARLWLQPRARAFTEPSRGTVEKAVTRALKRMGARDALAARRVLVELARRLDES